MKLSEKHMQAFRDAASPCLADRLAADLRRDYVDETDELSDELLLDRVNYGIEGAKRYDLTTRRSIAAFVFLMFAVGPRFDAQPRVGRILSDRAKDPDVRIDLILALVPEADWLRARSFAGDRSWPAHLREDAE